MHKLALFFSLILFGVLSACDSSAPPASSLPARDRPLVYVDNYPLLYFVERLAGDSVEGVLPAPPDEAPAFWMPDADTVLKMQQADLILLNGAGYAHWREKVSLPEGRVVETADAFKGQWMTIQDAVTHAHGNEPEHSHSGTAFTTWIDFQQAAAQASAVHAALARILPGQIEKLDRSLESLKSDLLALDTELLAIAAKFKDHPLAVSHPVYDYWGRRYGLNLKSLHWEPDSPLTDIHLKDLAALLEKHPAKLLVWEGEPLAENITALKKLGLRSVVFDPCGNRPETGDFLEAMRANLRNLSQAAE